MDTNSPKLNPLLSATDGRDFERAPSGVSIGLRLPRLFNVLGQRQLKIRKLRANIVLSVFRRIQRRRIAAVGTHNEF
jgi:hypothetical protein